MLFLLIMSTVYPDYLYGTYKGNRIEKMGVSKLRFNENNFTFDILYEGKNGHTLYRAEGFKSIDQAYILTKPKKNKILSPIDQFYSMYPSDDLTYDEVILLLKRSVDYTNYKNR